MSVVEHCLAWVCPWVDFPVWQTKESDIMTPGEGPRRVKS